MPISPSSDAHAHPHPHTATNGTSPTFPMIRSVARQLELSRDTLEVKGRGRPQRRHPPGGARVGGGPLAPMGCPHPVPHGAGGFAQNPVKPRLSDPPRAGRCLWGRVSSPTQRPSAHKKTARSGVQPPPPSRPVTRCPPSPTSRTLCRFRRCCLVPLALCRPSPQTLSTLRLPTPVAPPPHFPPRPLSREAAGEVPRSR